MSAHRFTVVVMVVIAALLASEPAAARRRGRVPTRAELMTSPLWVAGFAVEAKEVPLDALGLALGLALVEDLGENATLILENDPIEGPVSGDLKALTELAVDRNAATLMLGTLADRGEGGLEIRIALVEAGQGLKLGEGVASYDANAPVGALRKAWIGALDAAGWSTAAHQRGRTRATAGETLERLARAQLMLRRDPAAANTLYGQSLEDDPTVGRLFPALRDAFPRTRPRLALTVKAFADAGPESEASRFASLLAPAMARDLEDRRLATVVDGADAPLALYVEVRPHADGFALAGRVAHAVTGATVFDLEVSGDTRTVGAHFVEAYAARIGRVVVDGDGTWATRGLTLEAAPIAVETVEPEVAAAVPLEITRFDATELEGGTGALLLSWRAEAERCELEGLGKVPLEGARTVTPERRTQYRLVCTAGGLEVDKVVDVEPPRVIPWTRIARWGALGSVATGMTVAVVGAFLAQPALATANQLHGLQFAAFNDDDRAALKEERDAAALQGNLYMGVALGGAALSLVGVGVLAALELDESTGR